MKKLTRFPLRLCFCLSLIACQATTLSTQTGPLTPPTQGQRSVQGNLLSASDLLTGQLRIQTGTQDTLIWSALANESFQIQGVRRSQIKRLRLTIKGPGIANTLQTEAEVSGNTLPTMTLGPIPQGRFRVVELFGLDDKGQVLPGFHSSYVYHSPANGNHQVTMRRQENPLAQVILRLQTNQPNALNTLDLEALRVRLAQLSGARSGANQDGGYAYDPDFIDTDALYNLFDFNSSPLVIPELAAMQTASQKTPLQLTVHLATENGKNLNETLSIVLDHPTAATQTLATGKSVGQATFERLFYSASDKTYTLRVLSQSGTEYASLPISLAQNGTLTLDPQNTLAGANGSSAAQALIVRGAAESTLTTYFVSSGGNDGADGRSTASAWKTIQYAVDTAPTGSRIEIAAGNYSENVSINKVLTLVGAGNGADVASATHLTAPTPNAGSGLALNGSGNNDTESLSISGLRISGFNYGAAFTGQYIRLENLTIRDTSVALRVSSTGDMQHLTVHNSLIEDNGHGFYAAKDSANVSNLRHLKLTQTQFLRNGTKGLYFEKLSDAVFDGLTLSENGNRTDYGFNAGLELNLKWKWGANQDQDYANIVIKNSAFTGNGVLGTATNRMNPVSIGIKARDDAPSYNGAGKPPAALANVRLENNSISAPINAVRIGETGKTSAGTSAVVLTGNQLSLEGTDNNPRYLINNQTTAAIDASTNNTFNSLLPVASNGFSLEALLFDKNDQSTLGRINSGLPAGQTYVPYHSDGSLIQGVIDSATPGDTITLQDGVYNLNARTLSLNQAITLQGQSLSTVLQQAYAVGSDRVINISAAGARLRQLFIEKTNQAGVHNLIQVTANNVILENLKVKGLFADGDGDVSRAFEISGGLSGLVIQNNEIGNLRQPAYINANSSGNITANRVYGTRGWVIDGGLMTFANSNSWRSDGQATSGATASGNFGCDIALLNSNPVNAAYNNFYGALGSLENSLGDLLPAGPGMTGCDQRVLP